MTFTAFTDLLLYKTRANLRAEVSRLYLNYAWWALEPLFSMAVFYVVFGIFMNSQTPHFALFLLIGTTQWQWFSSGIMHASKSIRNAGHILQRVAIPKIFFPLETFLQDSFKHLFVLGLMAIFLVFYPVPVTMSWLSLPLIMLLQGFLVMTCAVLFASLTPFLPDLSLILGTALNIMFFISGIFFNVDLFILPEHRSYMYLNPMAGIIREYRHVIIDGQWPNWLYLGNVFLSTMILAAFTLWFIFRNDRHYPRICQE